MLIRVNDQGYVYDSESPPVWLPPINKKQLEIFSDNHRYLLVHGPRKASKCASGETIVRISGGISRLRCLVEYGIPGQSLPCSCTVISMRPDGTFGPELVTESWREPTKDALRIVLSSGHSVITSPWHPIWSSVDGDIRWRTASEISELQLSKSNVWIPLSLGHKHWTSTDYQAITFQLNGPRPEKDKRDLTVLNGIPKEESAPYTHNNHTTNLNRICRQSGLSWRRVRQWATNKIANPWRTIKLEEPLAYAIGLLVGDGCCTPTIIRSHAISFSSGDMELVDTLKNTVQNYFPGTSFSETRGFDHRLVGGALLGFIKHIGINCYSHQKSVPDEIIESPKSVVRAFLRGLFDTDGTVSKSGRVAYCSSSRQLADDVQSLLLEFGIDSSLVFKPNNHQGGWILRVDSRLFFSEIGFGLIRKQNRSKMLPEGIRVSHIRKTRTTYPINCADGSHRLDGSERWRLVKAVERTAADLYDITVPSTSNFVGNGFINHNTFGMVHKVIRHAFDVNGAMVGIVCKTIKNAKAAGVWVLLSRMLKMWQDGFYRSDGTYVQGCPGFTITEGPKTTGDSKMSFVRIRNRHGTISEIQCHSLEHSREVEAKFKGPAYSMFWLSEFDQYCDEHAFDIFCDALRMWPNVKYEDHQIICDCNPPDTGENNWIHDKWFKFKDREPSEGEAEDDQIFRDGLHRILVMIDDNPQLDPREKRELIARYKKRKALYNRYILGLWVQDMTNGHFSDVWDESIHVMGRVDCTPEEREHLIPTESCTSLLTGWDMGESKNHSFHILEKIITEIATTDHDGRPIRKVVVSFSILDELVVIRTYISIREFVLAVMDKIDYWNAYQKKHRKVDLSWRHWSDTSAFRERSAAEASEAAIAYEASGGRIILSGAPKYRDSRRDRVKLIWQFLYEKRLHVSAQLERTRTMFANLRQGGDAEYIKNDDHKHPFDSLSYPIIAEAPTDMFRSSELSTAPKDDSSGLVMAHF